MSYIFPHLMINVKAYFRRKSVDQITQELALSDANPDRLKKVLGVWDLTAMGVAAIVGAGIFSTIGNASYNGGPAVIFLFILTALACAFSAFCYAEFAATLPISGSAYSYAYASFGEFIAWIIGWDLLMEYAISNIAVAISWSEYFTGILASYGVHLPHYLTMDFLSAYRGLHPAALLAWAEAPRILGIPLICNLPALLVITAVTVIAYFGIRESKLASNTLVALKVGVILLVICVGAFYISPGNWVPFMPNGPGGVLKGISAVFFAYIGFDAISTTAEECKNPQRDLPRGMIYSLLICTTLYVLIALVITGMVNYTKLAVGDPLAFIFGPEGANIPWLAGTVAVSALVALFTVLLVYQLGQPRIWMTMSRDGLLPPIFSAIHPKYKTPWFSTLFTGVFVAVPSLFMNLTEVTDLTSTGTLFAFILVCGGVLRLDPNRPAHQQKFRTPYVNSRWIFPILLVIAVSSTLTFNPEGVVRFFAMTDLSHPEVSAWEIFKHKIPFLIFSVELLILAYFCFRRNLSLIPVLGITTCSYLMTELGVTNWIRFGVWLIIGFFVYFLYGVRHSRLRKENNEC